MIAVILAGGRGSRLGNLTHYTPKPLIKIGNKSIIEHQILLLGQYGIRKIWILSGYLGEQVRDFLGTGKKFGLTIEHLIENEPLGTAGALKQLEEKTKGDILVLSADIMLDIELKKLIYFHRKHKNALATIVVHPSDHPFDSDLVQTDKEGLVTAFVLRKNKIHPKNILFKNLTNTGIFIFSPSIFKYIKNNKKIDLEKDVFPEILKSPETIFAYKTAEYIKDVGTPERLKRVSRDVLSGKVARLNRKLKRPAIFMDRDGVINKEVDELTSIDDLKLLPYSAKAIKEINDTDYLSIVITNQASIAKGFMTDKYLGKIHNKLETLLGRQGAKLDAIYHCPHHPEKGFEGEVASLKKICNCRKPKIGLLEKAVKEFNIDLKKSYFIGDATVDAQTATNAGVKFIGVKTGYGLDDGKYKFDKRLIIKDNLLDAVNSILSVKTV